MFGNQSRIARWCKQNNWTELRQLNSGDWVAFPPGGVIETPLPESIQSPPTANSPLTDIAYGLILFIIAIALALISILISPLFWASRIRTRKKYSTLRADRECDN